MTSKEICAILEASKGTGIKEIKLKDLTLKFDNLTFETKPNNNSTKIGLNDTSRQLELNVGEVKDVGNIYEDKQTESELKAVHDEFELAHLMATDPESFEKRQRGL